MPSIAKEKSLNRSITIWGAFAIGSGTMVSGAIFVLPGAAYQVAGPAMVYSYILGGVVALLIALNSGEMAAQYPRAGGVYIFIHEVMGERWGLVSGWTMWFGLMAACAFYLVSFARFLDPFLKFSHHLAQTGTALLLLAVIAAVNIIGVKKADLFQQLMVAPMLALLVGFALAGFLAGSVPVSREQAVLSGNLGDILAVTGIIFVSYLGFMQLCSLGEEVKEPDRNIPRAMVWSVAVVTLLYLLILFALMRILPPRELAGTAPLQAYAFRLAGAAGNISMLAACIVATITSANVNFLSASRISFAMSRNGFMQGWAAAVHPVYSTPHRALVISTVVISAAIILGLFSPQSLITLSKIASALYLFNYTLICLCVVRSRKIQQTNPAFKVPFYPVLPLLGAVSCLLLLIYIVYTVIRSITG
ncbi:MAG: amino acid permease [Bacillota bacterium]